MSTPFKFIARPSPERWMGRYNRIPGKEPVFRAKVNGTAHAYWSPWQSDEKLTSEFVDCVAVRQMAQAVNQTKLLHAGQAGGAFQINEFGQVICPVGVDAERYWVGTVTGVPTFHDPRNPRADFDLTMPQGTRAGTPWDRPYIGMKFNLDSTGSIYFEEVDGDTKRKIRLVRSDPELVRRLRLVRGSGQGMRFIVNLHGVAITKTETEMQPVFVGHINLNNWFPKQP